MPAQWDDGGPCGVWPVEAACLPGWDPDPAKWTPAQQIAVEVATETMWRLTGGRYGLCLETVRPCRRACATDGYGTGSLLNPLNDSGTWTNIACGCTGTDCGCAPLCEVALPGRVDSVTRVLLGGVIVPPDAYRVDRETLLVRTDGGCWPYCQDLAQPIDGPDAFTVEYQRGRPVPVGGVRAHSVLAFEVAKACGGDSSCRLPSTVKQVDREGVSYTMYDHQQIIQQNMTGLLEVDSWVSLVNPSHLSGPPEVYSPDLPRMRGYRGVL